MKNLIFIILAIFLFIGCTSMKLEDFKNTSPKFVVKDYFVGNLKAYGLVKNRSGKVIKSFKAFMKGTIDEKGVITLDEDFIYNNGEKQKRIWTLKPNHDGTYTGTANDIVGTALLKTIGNTAMIDYTMEVSYNDSTINLNVKDWLHLQEDGVIINHSKMKKFGFEVGELVITIIKE